ncbi:hypothetical protein [Hyalangium sp.]|uniref:hypothetical protein n=1 Tax=Hyalangium sp. TaxID=2028555 RepID=UPI002D6499F0|nr:hypothetical protein [Hyalangium sp.]HYH97773.1 hypothetical protein [Hyalangium sp.]
MVSRRHTASTVRGWGRYLCGLWLLGLATLSGACRESVGTALYVTIDFPPSLLMDQLLVSGTVADSGIGPQLLPAQPERLLANGETFRILLPSAPDGSEAVLQVAGMREGTRVALGTGQVQIQEGSEVDVTVRLEPAGPDDGSFCADCPDGCCMDGVCTAPTFNTCGTGGIACKQCDPQTASTCSSEGFCACGRGPACDPRTADRCSNGSCRCGGGGPCGFGQQCVSGRCECTPGSCTGCCSGNTCEPGNTKDECGQGGAACVKCNRTCNASGSCT